MVVWPGGVGGPVCHSSEVRRWNVTANGNLMTKKMCVIGTCLYCWISEMSPFTIQEKTALLSAWLKSLCEIF